MPARSAIVMEPRKSPVQARSSATVEAILEATLQVLLDAGKQRLTTTRVAYRAGVSVGTLYQYFPNKQALLRALLRLHLARVTEVLERACRKHRHLPLGEMVTGIANAFFQAKMEKPETSLALYSVGYDVNAIEVLEELRVRSERAIRIALESAPERLEIDHGLAAFMVQSAMTGVARRMLESRIPVREHEAMRRELVAMLCAYVTAAGA